MTANFRRRRLLTGIAASLITPSLASAQEPRAARPKRLVYVPTQGAATMDRKEPERREGMVRFISEVLAQEGLVAGRDVACEYVDLDLSESDDAAVERRAQAVVDTRPDAILVGEDAITVFQRLTRTIPLVFYQFFGDPVLFGLVQSYARPAGNVTGTTYFAPGMEDKGLELLRELAPKAKRLGVMWRDDEVNTSEYATEKARMKGATSRLGFEYVDVVVAKSAKFAPLERILRASRIDALVVEETDQPWVPDLMRFVQQARIPALWPHAGRVRQGGLCSATPSTGLAMSNAISMVGLILRGADPATLPVRAPTHFVTAINLRTAKAMGLAVPPAVLVRATVVGEK